MSAKRAVVALGSNLGDRLAHLASALVAMDAHPHVHVVRVSSAYESAALKLSGVDPTAPEYLNAVALVDTELSPQELLTELMRIELTNGRERVERWDNRTLDLDIIDFDEQVIDTPDLTVPHPQALHRAFVLAPWAEVDPKATLGGLSVLDMASRLSDDIRPVGAIR